MSETPAIRPWSDLAADFRTIGWESTQALAELCEFIAARPVSKSLHGWKSGNVLGMALSAAPSAGRLEFDPTLRGPTQVRFADATRPENMWRRHEPPEKILERFRKAVQQLEWITDPAELA
jgi:hypothetical protein